MTISYWDGNLYLSISPIKSSPRAAHSLQREQLILTRALTYLWRSRLSIIVDVGHGSRLAVLQFNLLNFFRSLLLKFGKD